MIDTKIISIIFVLCAGLFSTGIAQANNTAGDVLRVTGRATVTSPDGQIRSVEKGSEIKSTDIVSTSARSYVRMKMQDETYIMVRPDSRMVVEDFKYSEKKPEESRGFFSLLKGGFRAVTGLIKDKKKYRYNTSVATIGIRGTEFSVRVCAFDCYDIDPVPENGLFLEVLDHDVTITTTAGEYTFTKGQFAYVAGSDSPAVTLNNIPDVFEQSPIPPADPSGCGE